PYKHPSCITELSNGDLYLVYYGGGGEYADETAVFGSRLRKGEGQWSAPVKIAGDPFRSLGNGVIWQAPDGVVWLFYVIRFGETWSSSRIQAKISRDQAQTWSDPTMLALEPGMLVRNRPIVLLNGDYLLPVYHETGTDKNIVGPESTARFLRFDPKKREWKESGVIRSAKGNIQPAPVQIDAQHLIAYCRRGGGYGPVADGFLIRSESRDGGYTWSEGTNSAFLNPNSAVDFLRLRNGHLLLVYNPSMSQRTPLRAALSTDNDKSYPHQMDIATGRDSFAYPVAIQTADEKIHVVYTSNQRKQINHAVFLESDLLR
ncbi:MAG: exo-alpha-sialidase, partial [Acidobacteriia bacterium]|nr:exo-alpha-sialidase [Terriglobia bacterium]